LQMDAANSAVNFCEAVAVIDGVRQKLQISCMGLSQPGGCVVRVSARGDNRGFFGRPWGGVKVLKRPFGRRRSTSVTPLSPLTLVPHKRAEVIPNNEFEYLYRRGGRGVRGVSSRPPAPPWARLRRALYLFLRRPRGRFRCAEP
jgi:hypothetical protein